MSTTTMLADAMPLIVWISGPDGAPTYCNQRWADYTGITFEQAREQGWKTLVHPDDVQETIDRWVEASAKGGIYEVEFRFRRDSDGSYRWHLGRAFPLRDDSGAITEWFGTCTDIEDQKQTRHELEKQVATRTEELNSVARRLGLATQALQAGVWEWDVHNDSLIWDGKMYELYGLAAGAPMSYREWAQTVIPEDLAVVEANLKKVVATKGQTSSEFRIKLPSGGIRYIHAAQSVVLDDAGEVVWVIGVNIDVTERKESEAALRLSENRFASAFQYATTGMALVSLEGRWMKVNQAVCELLGYSAEELAEKTFQDITHPEDLQGDLEKLEKLIRGEITFYKMEKRYFHKDGHIVWALLGVSLLRDQQNAPLYFISQIEDITEMKNALLRQRDLRKKAQAAERAKSEFLAIMSHEIRTPLNGVIGMTSILADTELDEMQRDCLHTIQTSGEALLSVINDILDYSKIEAGRLQIENHSFTLEKCVEETLDLFAAQIREKRLEAVYLVAPNVPPHLNGDALRLRQILVNLIGNAIKFTAKGEIVLKVDCPRRDENDCSLLFSVTDTGIGIPKEGMEKLFQSFQQVDTSTTRRYGGSGLGLVISKRLAEFMGGEMWVKSEVGVGSTFFFTANFALATDIRADDQADTARVLRGRSVLIVDDNATNRHILETQLKIWGMAPVTAASGAEALEKMGGQAFDIALLDFQMPEMDGVELAREMRRRGNVPLVLLSSSGETLEGAEGDLFRLQIPKPIRHSQLLKALLKLVGAEARPVRVPAGKRFDGTLADGNPLTILLAEDNATNQKVGMMMLSRLGYTADLAVNGLRAVEAAEGKAYDLILMDIQMPEMNGIEATQRIRERLGDKRPSIFALTAEALEGDEARFLAQGFDGYLSKPIQAEKLQIALKNVTRRG
jgi:PAS domain S-box-containing protein